MRVLISFGTSQYQDSINRLKHSAGSYFGEIRYYGPLDIDEDFARKNRRILDEQRGAGCWLWKPYFILRTLREAESHDYIMYVDSQMLFTASPEPLFWECDQHDGILLFHQKKEKRFNYQWTKRDAFTLMGCDAPKYVLGDNLVAGTQVYRKTPKAIRFLTDVLKWSQNWNVISDAPNITGPNYEGFRDHRHDQSVLSLSAIRHGIKPVCDITNYGVGFTPMDRLGGQIVRLDRHVMHLNQNAWINRPDAREKRAVLPWPDGAGNTAVV